MNGSASSCTTDVDCGPNEHCVVAREHEIENHVCRPGISSDVTADFEAAPSAPQEAPSATPPEPPTDEPLTTAMCPDADPAVPALAAGSLWVGQTNPASHSAADDGHGTTAHFGYVIGMRFSSKTNTLWVNDGQIRTVDASGNVTTRYGGALYGGYANIGVDSAGNGFAATTQNHVRKFPAGGGDGNDLDLALPPSCWLTSLNVGQDDHVYAVCRDSPNPGPGSVFVDVTDGNRVVLDLPIVSVATDFVVSKSHQLWIADPNDQQVRRYDLTTGEEHDLYATPCTVFTMAIDDAGYFYAASAKYAPSGRPIHRFARTFVYGLAATNDRVFAPTCEFSTAWGCELQSIPQTN